MEDSSGQKTCVVDEECRKFFGEGQKYLSQVLTSRVIFPFHGAVPHVIWAVQLVADSHLYMTATKTIFQVHIPLKGARRS
jgi:hypothetical protein